MSTFAPRVAHLRYLVGAALFASLSAASAFGVAACFSSSGAVSGGDTLFDTGAPTPVPCVEDDAAGQPITRTTWPELYADFFGPTGKASCSLNGSSCHGTSEQEGAKASLFVCGDTLTTCYQGIVDPNAALVDSSDEPTDAVLYSILRKKCGGGSMPNQPRTVAFSPLEMNRIAEWIRGGAKQD